VRHVRILSVNTSTARSYKVAGLFAGIGGMEVGLARAAHETSVLSEVWDPAALSAQAAPASAAIAPLSEV
jgi:hypothetical protein